MNDRQSQHPERSVLLAFGLGKLTPAEVAEVESHIAECPDCCETLQRLEGDTFVELVRRSDGLKLSTEGLSSAAANQTAAFLVDSVNVPDRLPSELANHPRYRIIRLLGRGGMGVVFAAEHRLMNRIVALKVIRPNLINRPEAVARFRREVQAAAKLHHPNIVTAYDAEQAGGLHFLVMEYVDGIPLSQIVECDGPLPVGTACGYVRQMADALQHAHRFAMVHRDIKPHNVMVGAGGQVKILDFGIATLAENPADAAEDTSAADSANLAPGSTPTNQGTGNLTIRTGRLTEIGTVMGTPDYVAPEQVTDASSADIRSDIYSLGCTLYFLLAGRPPFPEGNTHDKLRAHAQSKPPSLSTLNPKVPPELEGVVERMMAKDPTDRYATPAEVAAAIRPFAHIHPTHRDNANSGVRRFVLATLAAAACLCMAAAALIYVKTDQGMLEIETSEPHVQLVLSQGGRQLKVIDVRSGSSVERLPSGQYSIDLPNGAENLNLSVWSKAKRTGDFDVPLDHSQSGFTLSRGDRVLARVVRTPDVTPAVRSQSLLKQPQPPGETPVAEQPVPVVGRPMRITEQPERDARPPSLHPVHVRLQGNDGTQIVGDVDTERDTFTITTWTGSSRKTWTPKFSQLPLQLWAYTPSGERYDLPENWDGDTNGFAFLLPIGRDIMEIEWNEGQLAPIWQGSSFGWGGLRNNSGGVLLTGTHRVRYVPAKASTLSEVVLDSVDIEQTAASGPTIKTTILPPGRSRGGSRRPGNRGPTRVSLEGRPTDTTPILVQNRSFEDLMLRDNSFQRDKIPNWTVDAPPPTTAGIQNLGDADFAGATDGGYATTIPEGRNVAYCSGGPSAGAAISQVLSNKFEPNAHYILNVAVGRRATGDWPGYKVQLLAGGKVLAEDDNSLSPAPGEFLTSIVEFTPESNAEAIGQPIEMRLSADGGSDQSSAAQVQFDRVQIYSRPAAAPVDRPSISLIWSPVPGSNGYVIDRGIAQRTGPFQRIAKLEPDVTTYIDNDPELRPRATYYYRILLDGAESDRSTPIGVTTLTSDPPPGK